MFKNITKNLHYFVLFFLGILVLFSVYVLFYNLGSSPLDNWDEAWYAQMAKEMVAGKEFIVIHWNYEPLFDKPPMFIWIIILNSFIFGFNEFSARFPSAISAFIILTGVLIYSYKKWGFVPALIAFSTLIFNHLFIWRARSGNIDLFASLLIFISFFLISSKNPRRYLFLGIIFGLLYLTKLTIIIFPIAALVLYEVIYYRGNLIKRIPEYIKLMIAFLLISSSWLILGYLKEGSDFVIYYVFNSDQSIVNPNNLKFTQVYIWHAYYALQRRFSFVFIAGIIFLIHKIKSPINFLLLFFSLCFLVVLSFSQKNNNWYLIPSMPFWSLVIGYAAFRVIKLFKDNIFIKSFIVLGVVVLSYRTFTINILPIINTTSSFTQAEAAKEISKLSNKEDLVIRLDHLYPTTIYYSGRKVKSALPEIVTNNQFISKNDLIRDIDRGEKYWVSGKNSDIANFINDNPSLNLKLIEVNSEESIIKAN